MQWLDFEDVGKFVKDVGFDGVDLTVRKGGHIEPGEVTYKLPTAVDQITKASVVIPMMATNIKDAMAPNTDMLLKTASRNGIKYYRMAIISTMIKCRTKSNWKSWPPPYNNWPSIMVDMK